MTLSRSREQIRVVVVDDSQFMRTLITSILEQSGIDVVAHAADGAEAVDAVRRHRPHVVTMDLHMPNVDGVEGIERIMASVPTPILVLSAYASEQADQTLDALRAGAADFLEKPGGELTTGLPTVKGELIDRVVALSKATAITPDEMRTRSDASVEIDGIPDNPTLVVGASTGGPAVVERLLADLPLSAGFRVLVVQHMPAGFTRRFADRLDAKSAYSIQEATTGAELRRGEVLVAPGGSHMAVVEDADGVIRVDLTDDPPRHGVRPAVDVTMSTAAKKITTPMVALVLTGMGEDGSQGVEAMSQAGARVLAQDRDSSAVYGMPMRAVETGCVDEQVGAGRLAERVVAAVVDTREGVSDGR